MVVDAVARQREQAGREQAHPDLAGRAPADREHEQRPADLVEQHQHAPGGEPRSRTGVRTSAACQIAIWIQPSGRVVVDVGVGRRAARGGRPPRPARSTCPRRPRGRGSGACSTPCETTTTRTTNAAADQDRGAGRRVGREQLASGRAAGRGSQRRQHARASAPSRAQSPRLQRRLRGRDQAERSPPAVPVRGLAVAQERRRAGAPRGARSSPIAPAASEADDRPQRAVADQPLAGRGR